MSGRLPSVRLLDLAVFSAGLGVMGIEMSAARLLAPYFGTSLLVWTNLIGLIMIALTAGYYAGGLLADRRPEPRLLFRIILAAGLFTAILPWVVTPVLGLSMQAMKARSLPGVYAALLAVVLLCALPVLLLGMIGPFAIRLASTGNESLGGTAGRIYALSTAGSIIGTFLPALVTIPLFGTRNTILLFALILLAAGLPGLSGRARWVLLAVPLLCWPGGHPVKPAVGLIHERESAYNYIQVVETRGRRSLILNEGETEHSRYMADGVRVGNYWDCFSILPLLQPTARTMLLIGLAGGTIPRAYARYFPQIRMDGVEIDPEIVAVGRKYFDLDQPNLRVHLEDGRRFLMRTDHTYDLIVVDAFRPPYIPFHLATTEFFQLVQGHLNPGGLLAMNIGATREDSPILQRIAASVRLVLPHLWIFRRSDRTKSWMLIATEHDPGSWTPTPRADLEWLCRLFQSRCRKLDLNRDTKPLTDDHAPVEWLTDRMILDYARNLDTR